MGGHSATTLCGDGEKQRRGLDMGCERLKGAGDLIKNGKRKKRNLKTIQDRKIVN